ncbi:DUF2071 domain-containing protein [Saezia sanguinis]|uniref:DUF2071 domain-containing protein n=1 Tax=Saezia sanguinis TaxID=1965230 RepID=UPI00306A7956
MDSNNEFIYPSPHLWGKCCNKLLNSHRLLAARRATISRLPFVKLESGVHDIVYLNWLVDIDALRGYIPDGLQIKQQNGRTLFTILTYRHRHFGPIFMGPLRGIFPSPLQSNWRLYLDTLPDGTSGAGIVLFLKNILNSFLYTAGSRIFSDALPSHLAAEFEHTAAEGTYSTHISSGQGSAPALSCTARQISQKKLPPEFSQWYGDWNQALTHICLQHSAVVHVESINRIAHAGIELPIDTSQALPLQVDDIQLPFLEQLGANPSELFAFAVPQVQFQVLWEQIL